MADVVKNVRGLKDNITFMKPRSGLEIIRPYQFKKKGKIIKLKDAKK